MKNLDKAKIREKLKQVGALYSEKYNLAKEVINDKTPKIIFDMDNPFIK